MPGFVRQALGHAAGGHSVLTDAVAGAELWCCDSSRTCAWSWATSFMYLYPDGSQLPGKNQGLGKGSYVY